MRRLAALAVSVDLDRALGVMPGDVVAFGAGRGNITLAGIQPGSAVTDSRSPRTWVQAVLALQAARSTPNRGRV